MIKLTSNNYILSVELVKQTSESLVLNAKSNADLFEYSLTITSASQYGFLTLGDIYEMFSDLSKSTGQEITLTKLIPATPATESVKVDISCLEKFTKVQKVVFTCTLIKTTQTNHELLVKQIKKLESDIDSLVVKNTQLEKFLSGVVIHDKNTPITPLTFSNVDSFSCGHVFENDNKVYKTVKDSIKVCAFVTGQSVQRFSFRIHGKVEYVCGNDLLHQYNCLLNKKHTCTYMSNYGKVNFGYYSKYQLNGNDVCKTIEQNVIPIIANFNTHSFEDGKIFINVDQTFDVYVNLEKMEFGTVDGNLVKFTKFNKSYDHLPTFNAFPKQNAATRLKMITDLINGGEVDDIVSFNQGSVPTTATYNKYSESSIMLMFDCPFGLTIELH